MLPIFTDYQRWYGEWLTNMIHNTHPNFSENDRQYLEQLGDRAVLGIPKGTEHYSSKELEDMGMMGVYLKKNPQ